MVELYRWEIGVTSFACCKDKSTKLLTKILFTYVYVYVHTRMSWMYVYICMCIHAYISGMRQSSSRHEVLQFAVYKSSASFVAASLLNRVPSA